MVFLLVIAATHLAIASEPIVVISKSDPIVSPSGNVYALVVSYRRGSQPGITMVVLRYRDGCKRSPVVSDGLRVDLKIVWKSETELVIEYPKGSNTRLNVNPGRLDCGDPGRRIVLRSR